MCAGGAGGKTVWGKPGCEIDAAPATSNDPRDPNYVGEGEEDDDLHDAVASELRDTYDARPSSTRKLSDAATWFGPSSQLSFSNTEREECERLLAQMLPQYLLSGDATEVIDALEDANFANVGVTIVAHIIEMALDRKDSERELAAILVAALVTQRIVGSDDVANAFELLLARLPDLLLDNPQVVQTLAKFIARSIADDVLPPVFATRSHSDSGASSASNSVPASPLTPFNTPVFRTAISPSRTLSSSAPSSAGVAIPGRGGARESSPSSLSTVPTNSIDEKSFNPLHAALLSTSPREAISALEAAAAGFAARRQSNASTSSSSLSLPADPASEALHLAKTLINMKHGFVRLDNVFGVSGGRRTVKQLSKKIGLLLREYLSSDDLQEAERCVRELEVPHFHHEVWCLGVLLLFFFFSFTTSFDDALLWIVGFFWGVVGAEYAFGDVSSITLFTSFDMTGFRQIVYEAIVMMMEKGPSRHLDALVKLISSLAQTMLLTPDQIEQGVIRIYEDLPDLVLDIPNASKHLQHCIDAATRAGWLSASAVQLCSSKASSVAPSMPSRSS